jgi:hypothetical protein
MKLLRFITGGQEINKINIGIFILTHSLKLIEKFRWTFTN